MNNTQKPTEEGMVTCEVCLKEVPQSEAKSDEASDYMRYFCGLDCYVRWQKQHTVQKDD